jgi:hypothetical protein
MSDSILDSVKPALGVLPEYTAYDPTIVMYINAALSNLTDVGVGPATGFAIQDSAATWSDFLGDSLALNKAMTYLTLRVKLWWDTPANPSVTAALEEQCKETLWRARRAAESSPFIGETGPIVLDGGTD